jgi:predicted DNA-binding protein (MmcQ/YjbR family)
MDGRAVLAWCRRQPGATEETPFGPETLVFKAGGRMFAAAAAVDPDSVTLKADPDLAEFLREQYPGITPGYHMNKRHWNTVALDGSVPTDVIRQLLEQSYGLVSQPTSGRRRSRPAVGFRRTLRPTARSWH